MEPKGKYFRNGAGFKTANNGYIYVISFLQLVDIRRSFEEVLNHHH